MTRSLHKRIENGKAVIDSRYPFIGRVYLEETDDIIKFVCTATLLDAVTVLTVAHCFCENEELNPFNHSNYSVEFGSPNINDFEYEQTSLASKIILHPDSLANRNICSGDTITRGPDVSLDLAVMKLAKPMTFTRAVKPIRLSSLDYTVQTPLIHAGFGKFRDIGRQTHDLQLYHAPSNVCYREGIIMWSCVFCGLCFSRVLSGDSGGPVLSLEDGHFVQVGIIVATDMFGSAYYASHDFKSWVMSQGVTYPIDPPLASVAPVEIKAPVVIKKPRAKWKKVFCRMFPGHPRCRQ